MPVYEFECKCGHVFEDLVPMGTNEAKCPPVPERDGQKNYESLHL